MKNAARLAAALAAGAILLLGIARADELTDAQIAEIVVKANEVDIDAGRLAFDRASTPDVKAFARAMVAEHAGIRRQAVALVTRLMITPQASLTSHSLEGGGADNIRLLRKLSARDFDRAYIGHEVAYHQQVLDAVDGVLIPGAHDPQLKSLLTSVRPVFAAHLEHAKRVRDMLR